MTATLAVMKPALFFVNCSLPKQESKMKSYHRYEKAADSSNVKCSCCRNFAKAVAKRIINRHDRRATRQAIRKEGV